MAEETQRGGGGDSSRDLKKKEIRGEKQEADVRLHIKGFAR